MKDIIVVDIDGTISIVGDRLEYLKEDPPNWDDFYENCGEDKPNQNVIETVQQLGANDGHYDPSPIYDIVYCTGRRESVREKTMDWLLKYGLPYPSHHELLMRPDGDHRHDTELKPELIEPYKDRILCILEDRNSMVKKWRELGYTCLQVQEGDF